MANVDSLWDDDDDVVETVPKRLKQRIVDSDDDDDDQGSSRPAKRPRQTLFLPGSDDEGSDVEVASRPAAPPPPSEKDIDIDAIFEGLDDDEDDLAHKPLPIIDADEMERQARARLKTTQPQGLHQVMPSSSPTRGEPGRNARGGKGDDEEKKTKRRPVLLNEALLLGPTGFPELIKNVKDFKIKGKGHEASDLNRLLGVYQFWTHGLYPKTQFKDTVARVEKLCHSKRMQVALSVWKDEAKGIQPQADSDAEDDAMDTTEPTQPAPRHHSEAPSSNASRRSTSPPPVPSSRPPSSASEYDDVFDEDFEALLQAETAPSGAQSTAGISSSTSKSSAGTTEPTTDEDFWADMAEMNDEPAPPKPSAPAQASGGDEDQEMWDIFDQVQAEQTTSGATSEKGGTGPNSTQQPPKYADPSEWDDMYE